MNPPYPSKRYAEDFDPNPERRKIQRAWNKQKFKLISNASAGTYVDLVVEIVAIFHSNYGCDIHVTDYTTNTQLKYRPAPEETGQNGGGNLHGYRPSGWGDSPYGQQILNVYVKSPTADFIQRFVRPRDIVLLQNVNVKTGKAGYTELEAVIFSDFKYPEKILVQKLTDRAQREVAELLDRKQQYLATRPGSNARGGAALPPPATTVSVPYQSPSVTSAQATRTVSKSQAKKVKAKAREERKAKELADAEEILRKESEEEELKKAAAVPGQPNKHVRCAKVDADLTRLQDIMDVVHPTVQNDDGSFFRLPYLDLQFRARVKVLDYLPNDLADFAILVTENEGTSDDESENRPKRERWEWSCQLFVQDMLEPDKSAEDRMILHMGHRQMEYLLGKDFPNADDLRRNTSLKSKLSQKLSILWGDMEEQKSKRKMFLNLRPTNLPFDCCIAEYGVLKEHGRADDPEDWERRYMLGSISIP